MNMTDKALVMVIRQCAMKRGGSRQLQFVFVTRLPPGDQLLLQRVAATHVKDCENAA
jgi:hypothetical protein